MHPALSTLIALAGLASTAVSDPAAHASGQETGTPTPICDVLEFPVYFAPTSTSLAPSAAAVLEAAAMQLDGCVIEQIELRHAGDDIEVGQARLLQVKASLHSHAALAMAPIKSKETFTVDDTRNGSLPPSRAVTVHIDAMAPGVLS